MTGITNKYTARESSQRRVPGVYGHKRNLKGHTKILCDMAKPTLRVGAQHKPGAFRMEKQLGVVMWYAVWVRTGQEEKVLALCKEMLRDRESDTGGGKPEVYEQCFLPRYERARKLDGKWVRRKEVLFPGYLFFISENVDELVRRLKDIQEFTKVLGDGREPVALYPDEVEFLQKYTNEDKVLGMSLGFIEGDKLVVTEGPLKDYQGKIIHIDRHKRLATLEMEFFGRIVRIKVGVEVVRKV